MANEPVVVMVPIFLKPGQDFADFDPNAYEIDLQPYSFKFAQRTDKEIIDEMGTLNVLAKACEKWLATAKDVLKGRLKMPEVVGDNVVVPGGSYFATVSLKAREDIDRELIKKEMGEDWYAAHCKRTEYTELRIKPNPENA